MSLPCAVHGLNLLRESGWVTVTHGLGTFINPPEDRKTP
jgi:DNA-binding GntR family transcriptional regulator